MPRIEYVRVRDNATKHEFSVVASAVIRHAMTVLDGKPATKPDGTPLPPKHFKALESLIPAPAEPAEAPAEPRTEPRREQPPKSLSSKGRKATPAGHTADPEKEND